MNFRNLSTALTALALCATLFSCTKQEETTVAPPPPTDIPPTIPSGDRIIIHFGTSTYMGCMYSFSNCIWIGWGANPTNFDGRVALQFDNGDEAGQYFGQYFPLTADFTVDAATAKTLGIEPQVIPAGFYPLRDISSGQATGKRSVIFNPAEGYPVQGLVNPNNPQDNIGQLHNLAVQVVLNQNAGAIKALNGDRAAIQKLLTEKTNRFLTEAELPVPAAEVTRANGLDLHRDYADYAARLDETHLSATDKKALLAVFNEAAALPVRTPEDLSKFVRLITERENQLVNNAQLDNPKVVLSMVSVLKYSRYFWFWKSLNAPVAGGGTADAARIPDWVWADIIGMELGGPLVSAVASTVVYLDTH